MSDEHSEFYCIGDSALFVNSVEVVSRVVQNPAATLRIELGGEIKDDALWVNRQRFACGLRGIHFIIFNSFASTHALSQQTNIAVVRTDWLLEMTADACISTTVWTAYE